MGLPRERARAALHRLRAADLEGSPDDQDHPHHRDPDHGAAAPGGAVVTAIAPQPIVSRPSPAAVAEKGSRLSNLLRTTDHKTIGLMYLVTSFAWLLVGGLMAMLMRGELARPGLQFLSPEQYNQLFTMHGTIMLLF